MPEEFESETFAFRRSLDQTWNVGKNESVERAEIRLERRELIRADLCGRIGEDIEVELAGVPVTDIHTIINKLTTATEVERPKPRPAPAEKKEASPDPRAGASALDHLGVLRAIAALEAASDFRLVRVKDGDGAETWQWRRPGVIKL